MKGHGRPLMRLWMIAVGVLMLIAGHVLFFNRLRHAGLSLVMISGLAVLAIAKHLGLFGSLYRLSRRGSGY